MTSLPSIGTARAAVIIAAAALLMLAGLVQVLLRLAPASGEPGDIFMLVVGAVQFSCGLIALIYFGRRLHQQRSAQNEQQDDSPST